MIRDLEQRNAKAIELLNAACKRGKLQRRVPWRPDDDDVAIGAALRDAKALIALAGEVRHILRGCSTSTENRLHAWQVVSLINALDSATNPQPTPCSPK